MAMPNGWFYYAVPLLICIAFFIVGLAMLRSPVRRDPGDENLNSAGGGFAGVLLRLTGGSVGLAILTLPGQWKRQELFDRVFRAPTDRIERFVIEPARPDAYRPLTKSQVVIDDAPRIRRIADVFRTAQAFSPKRPHARWTAHVVMVTRDGTYHLQVEYTGERRNGTVVHLWSNPDGGGWDLGSARADGLEAILEEAAHSAAAR